MGRTSFDKVYMAVGYGVLKLAGVNEGIDEASLLLGRSLLLAVNREMTE